MSEYRSYTEQMTVLDGDSDFRRCLKPSALFRYVEQVSADHARAYGMDHAFFRERRSAFLVGKQALRVWRMPGRAEKINLTTACEASERHDETADHHHQRNTGRSWPSWTAAG